MAEKTNFTDTIHCLSRAHCNTCRNLEGGRTWRKSLTSLFVLPDEKVDFECPYGKKWEETTQPKGARVVNGAGAPQGASPTGSSTTQTGGCGCSRAAAARKSAKK